MTAMHLVKIRGIEERPKGSTRTLEMALRYNKSKEFSMAWQNCHMKVGILKVQDSKPAILRQPREDSQSDHSEPHVSDIFLKAVKEY